MGLTGRLGQIAIRICPHCRSEYGKHSKKNFIRCLYTADYNLYNATIKIHDLEQAQLKEETPEVGEKITVDADGKIEVEKIE